MLLRLSHPTTAALAFTSFLLLIACHTTSTTRNQPTAHPATAAADSAQGPAAVLPNGTNFGKMPNGMAMQYYTLQDRQGSQATISTYRHTLTSLLVPDKSGKLWVLVLGFEELAGYTSNLY